MYYVYILFSKKISRYYCGQTNNLALRIEKHNVSETISNKHGIPWNLVGFILTETRSQAIILEKKIKKRGIERWLKANSNNLLREM